VLLGVWHFSFTVSDIERSIAFYRDLLGFELIAEQEQQNEYTEKLVGYSGAHLKVAQLVVPGQPRGLSTHDLELVEYVHPKGERQQPDIKNPGEAHLCLSVTDIVEPYERLVAAGVHFFSPPNAITAGVNTGGFTCYFHDPDQIVLELQQAPPARLAAYLERVGDTSS
jgi:catechol 2,3-dioxygenase-like lactoylglutathione lyase family enzyme